MNDTDDTPPAVEVIDCTDLKPCPFRSGPWPERLSARCNCCGDTMEVFIEMREVEHEAHAPTQIASTGTAHYLAKSASSVGLDGLGGWLLVRSQVRGQLPYWICRDCAQVALDYESEEVADAVGRWLKWSRVEVEDRVREGSQPRKWGRR